MQARRQTRPAKRPVRQLPQAVKKPLEHLVLAASAGAVLSLVYLLFIILSGGLAYSIVGGTALDDVTRNVGIAKSIFLWCLWIVVLAAMIRHYRTETTGWVTILVGAGCWALLPYVVSAKMEMTTARELMLLGQSLITSFQVAGGALVVLGVLRVAFGRIWVLTAPARFSSGDAAVVVSDRADERPSLLRQCWELHFCRSSLRTNCPRFVESVACWKRKSGCYCDQGLATRLLTGVGGESRENLAEELEVAQRRARAQTRRQSKGKQKAPCGECPIYLEHQKHKYRVVSWLAYPAAAAIIGTTLASLQNGYRWVELEAGMFLGRFQVLPESVRAHPLESVSWLSAENAAILLLGVLLVGVLLQLTEVAVFKLKL